MVLICLITLESHSLLTSFQLRKMADRYERALSQRMYLLSASRINEGRAWEFNIEGSRGIPYLVRITDNGSRCNCPDMASVCKHIMFISLRVLRYNHVETCLTGSMDDALSSLLVRNESKQSPMISGNLDGDKEKIIEGESCSICFEDFKSLNECSFCTTCKKAIHKECIKVWLRQRATCPLCRGTWQTSSSSLEALAKFNQSDEVNVSGETLAGSVNSTKAKKDYYLTEEDLSTLECTYQTNPVFPNGAPMRLYRIADIEAIARRKRLEKEEELNRKRAKKLEAERLKQAKLEERKLKKEAKLEEQRRKREAREKKKAEAAQKKEEAVRNQKKAPRSRSKDQVVRTGKEENEDFSKGTINNDSQTKRPKTSAPEEEQQDHESCTTIANSIHTALEDKGSLRRSGRKSRPSSRFS